MPKTEIDKLGDWLIKNKFTPKEAKEFLKTLRDNKGRQYSTFRHDFSGQRIKIGVLGDTHFGNKWTDKKFLNDIMNQFKKDRVEAVYHVGDMTDGPWQRHKNVLEQYAHGFDAQVQDFVDDFPDINIPIYIIQGNHDCLDLETEVLTLRGWKRYDEINKKDKILSLREGKCFWDKINKVIIKEPDTPMVNVDTKAISLSMTEKHRVLAQHKISPKKYSGLKYIRAKDLSGRIKIPTSASLETEGLGWPSAKVGLMAWILTDGACRNGRCEIYQSKSTETIESLLNFLKIKYRVTTRNRNIEFVCGKKLKKKPLQQKTIRFKYDFPDKYPFPEELFKMNDLEFECFLHHLINGDGSRYKKGCFILYGVKSFLDKIQALCHMHNRRATLTYDNRGSPRLNISKRTYAEFDCCYRKKKGIADLVWCLSVPETNFMIRREGKVCFTGNSWYLKQDGGSVGKAIALRRPDITYLGNDEATIQFGKIQLMLSHPDDGNAYAYSYKSQKFIEALVKMGEEVPEIICQGHYHKIFYMNASGTNFYCTGTTERQTPWMRNKKIAADMGAWEIDIYRNSRGGLVRIVNTLFPHIGEKHRPAIK